MKSRDIRETFLKYFEKKGHKRLPSASLVPTDPTVLLTLAGMLPFKPIFLGVESPKYKRATSVQKCIRMNDIDNVGKTTRHHTFFEMLGNFSFGDYFKEDAVAFAWEFLTDVLELDPKKLVIAVYEKDDEAYAVWNKKIGISEGKIYRLSEENNFWAAGPTGPCGPCSEIYYDYGTPCKKTPCDPACDCERFLEIWNLVFIQYDRDEKGNLNPLPKKNIDTGMGLERIARVLQGKTDNFETDLFEPIMRKLPDKSASSKIIADHARAAAHLISDSVLPSNEGRGYVLRRLIRRAIVHGRKLKLQLPFLSDLAKIVISEAGSVYPELIKQSKTIEEAIREEETGFSQTYDAGIKMLDELFLKRAQNKLLSGEEVFKLHDTYGFPSEIVRDIASGRGYKIDEAGFNSLMEEQRQRARGSASKIEESFLHLSNIYEEKYGKTAFVGYDKLESEVKVLAVLEDQKIIMLDKTPFYPEGGGEIYDTGLISDAHVLGVFGKIGGMIFHKVNDASKLKIGDKYKAKVDAGRRTGVSAHHTATHLLHAALRKVLGDGVKQAGSFVGPDNLRFDFNFNRAMTDGEIETVEKEVNSAIKDQIKVEKFEAGFDEAKQMGAVALFAEKYGETVRVIKVPDISIELCGGCHVDNTSQIGFFKIIREEAIASGLRRIEAVAGQFAKIYVVYKGKELKNSIDELMLEHRVAQAKKELLGGGKFLEADVFDIEQTELERLSAAIDEKDIDKANKFLAHLEGRVDWLRERNKNLNKEICDLESQEALKETDFLLSKAAEIKGIKVVSAKLCEVSVENMRLMGDKLKSQLKSGIVILASTISDKVSFLVLVTSDLVGRGFHAGNLAKILADVCGGGGGGRPDKAEAGGRDIQKIDEAMQKALNSL